MIKAILIDDEKHCIITLQHLLNKFTELEIVATTQVSTEAKALIEMHQPDIVFIDIEMPILNGFDVLNQFENMSFKVVFTTAYDQYALQALRLNALDYLLKPIAKEDVEEVITKFKNQEINTTKDQIQNLHIFNNGKMQDTIALSTSNGLIFVKIEDIMYLEAESCYTYITMQSGVKHLASKTMALFETVLNDNPVFFRAHKSYILNLKFIKQYVRGEGGEIIMLNEKSISLSRNKKQEFMNLFTKI